MPTVGGAGDEDAAGTTCPAPLASSSPGFHLLAGVQTPEAEGDARERTHSGTQDATARDHLRHPLHYRIEGLTVHPRLLFVLRALLHRLLHTQR